MAQDVNEKLLNAVGVRTTSTAQTLQPYASEGGEVYMAQRLPPETALAQTGAGLFTTSVISGYTATQAMPTTSAMLSLYNGNATGGKSLIIASVGALVYTGANSNGSFALLARNDVPGANTAITTTNIISASDGRLYTGGAVSKSLVTLGAISASNNTAWVPVGASLVVQSASTGSFYGGMMYAECYGRWIVRPGGMFSLSVVGGIASGAVSFVGSMFAYEAQLSLP